MKKLNFMKSKKFVTYAKNSFVLMKMRKVNLNFIIRLKITVITQENLEELLIAFAIKDKKN